jgi:hypothetical protein
LIRTFLSLIRAVQLLYRQQAAVTGGRGLMPDGGYKIKSVKMPGAKGKPAVALKFLINDTRMQVFLPKAVTPNGGQ